MLWLIKRLHSFYPNSTIILQTSVIRLEIMPMHRPAPWMVKQCANAAGNARNGNFSGLETHAWTLDNEKLKQKQQFFL